MAGVTIELAGHVSIAIDGRAVDEQALRGTVARRVLAVLALEGRAVSRDELGDAVWGEDLPRTWETALRGAVHQLRRAATELDPARRDLVRTAFGCYRLDPTAAVDLLVASADLDAADHLMASDPAGAAVAADRAASVLAKPILPGLEGEWLDLQRRRFAPLRVRALLTASAAFTACGDHRRGVEAADAAVHLDPYREPAHRQLMAARAAGGDRAGALLAFRRCRAILSDELGVGPSAETEAAHRSVIATPAPVIPLGLPQSVDTTMAIAGRDREVATLSRAWDSVARGGSAAIALVGRAGVGKSRLASEVAAVAHRAGAATLHGRFDPDDLGAFGAFAEVFGQLGMAWPPPELGGGIGADRSTVFDAAVTALASAASSPRLVVVLDDVHWADRPSVSLLAHLVAARVPGLLVVATARDDWTPPVLAEVLESVTTLVVPPLDADGTGRMIATWAGQCPDDATVTALHERSGGNPFLITALLQDLADRGAIDLVSGITDAGDLRGTPAKLAGLVAAAIERCSPPAAVVARAAAVLGDEFPSDLLAEVAGQPPGVTAATLERLVHARILGSARRDTGRFRFVHALVRQCLLDGTDPEESRAIHRAAATILDRRAPEGSVDVLRHLLAAHDDATLPRAVELGLETADDLVDRGAPEEAIHLLHALLAWLEAAGEMRPARAAVLLTLATAEISMDRLGEGRSHLRQAAELAVTLGDPSVLRNGVILLRPPTEVEHDAELVTIARRLLELCEPRSGLAASVKCWIAAEIYSREPEEAAELATAAVEDAHRLGDPALHRLAALTWHLLARAFTDPGCRRSAMELVRTIRSPIGRGMADVTAGVFLTGDCLELGDRAAAEHIADEVAHATRGFGSTHLRWLALRNLVMLRVLAGRLDEAEELAAEAGAVAAALPIPEAVTMPVFQSLTLRYHQHRFDELHPLLVAFDEIAPRGSPVPIVRGWVEAELGLPTAPASVDRAVTALSALPRSAGWVGLTAITLEAAATVGHPSTAELAASLESRSGEHAVIVTIAYLGAIDRYLGLAARATGDTERARALLQRAAEQHEAIGTLPYLARTTAEREALS